MSTGYRPDVPAPEGTRDAPAAKVAGLEAQNLKDKFTGEFNSNSQHLHRLLPLDHGILTTGILDKKHTGFGSHTNAGGPSKADLDVGKRFKPEGGMRSNKVDTTGHQTKGE